ncbi:MAG: zinc ribbon domain-containing protein [Chloroflexi bacterium]|uniref:Zinc ribbon domain-containing protein n=1 Tax=Candidatus Chlorohelix allophototropha TaxID=3003348 RepID=A0A8T7LV36_9CHLR|nr:zinc ribbon domain-containing protein [Chloroflexota bacterium]WJW66603.1 zinc ribbon domain-containing protein [Chloroflexota bacterium L227-S17]
MPQDLINQVQSILNSVVAVLQIIATFLIAFLVIIWLTLCFWTFRDIQSRTRDIVAQIFATLLVVFFNIPGVLIYLLVRPKHTLEHEYEQKLQEEYMLQDLEEREICPTCRVKTQPDFMYCYSCRTRLRKDCPSCGQVIKLKWHNCPYCGMAQKPPSREETLNRMSLRPGAPQRPAAAATTALTREDVEDTSLANIPQTSGQRFKAPSLRAGYADDFEESANLPLDGNNHNDITRPDYSRYKPPTERDLREE